MPTVNGKYVSPTWHNDAPPALEETELQAITDWLAHHAKNGHAIGGSDPLTVDDIGAAPKNLSTGTSEKYSTGTTTPDQALSFLGDYNIHWWKYRSYQNNYSIAIGQYVLDTTFSYDDLWATTTVQYSSSVTTDSSGNISLVNPSSISFNFNEMTSYQQLNALNGKYTYMYSQGVQGNQVIHIASDSPSVVRNVESGTYFIRTKRAYVNSYFDPIVGQWSFYKSVNRNTYPDSGVVDGNEYQYIGIPFKNLIPSANIEYAEYTGTGVFGIGYKTKISFFGSPSILFCSGNNNSFSLVILDAKGYNVNTGASGICNVVGNVAELWSGDGAYNQFNTENVLYKVVAITNIKKQ